MLLYSLDSPLLTSVNINQPPSTCWALMHLDTVNVPRRTLSITVNKYKQTKCIKQTL